MDTSENRQFYLKRRPRGLPGTDDVPMRRVPMPQAGANQVLLRNRYISLDPAIRGWMSDAPNYIEPIALNDVIRAMTVSEVVESNATSLKPGDFVTAVGGWQEYCVADAAAVMPIDARLPVPHSHYLSALGLTGMTAYFGLLDVAKPQPGEVVVVSAAAGAVGSIVGQIAKIHGCRVIGIAGSDDKCTWITRDLGFDAAINYRRTLDMEAALREVCPEGIDIYFDNVGGDILDAVLLNLRERARIVICGWISTYNDVEPRPGPRNLWQLLAKSSRMEGFVVSSYYGQFGPAIARMAQWVLEGKLSFREDIVDGFDNTLSAFHKLFDGSNTGKLMIKVY